MGLVAEHWMTEHELLKFLRSELVRQPLVVVTQNSKTLLWRVVNHTYPTSELWYVSSCSVSKYTNYSRVFLMYDHAQRPVWETLWHLCQDAEVLKKMQRRVGSACIRYVG